MQDMHVFQTHLTFPKLRNYFKQVCVLGDAVHCEQELLTSRRSHFKWWLTRVILPKWLKQSGWNYHDLLRSMYKRPNNGFPPKALWCRLLSVDFLLKCWVAWDRKLRDPKQAQRANVPFKSVEEGFTLEVRFVPRLGSKNHGKNMKKHTQNSRNTSIFGGILSHRP